MLMKLARRVVKARFILIAVFVALTAVTGCMISKATINYDFTDYLSKDTVTRRSLDIMEREFGTTEQLTVMFKNLDEETVAALAKEFDGRDGVLRASHDPVKDVKTENGAVYTKIDMFLDCDDAVQYVAEFKKELGEREDIGEFFLSGTAEQTLELQERISKEVLTAMIIAVAVVTIVLFLSSHSYFEPLIFMLVLIVSIVINMGTNWIFRSISFVTFAVAAILQLALAMDYSIMLLHNYFDIAQHEGDRMKAMELALARSFMPISSSALTTVSGLAALMFMSFTIGFDIGIVLAKGIIISMITVFLMMPALILVFWRPLEKTKHKPLPLGGRALGGFAVKSRRIIAPILIVAILLAAGLQSKNRYLFTDENGNIDSNQVSRIFGVSNQMVLLFPAGTSDEDVETQRALVQKLEALTFNGKPAVTSITSLVTTADMAVKYYTLDELHELTGLPKVALSAYTGVFGFGTSVRGDELVDKAAEMMPANEMIRELKSTLDFARGMFIGKDYARMILLMDIPYFGDDMYRFLDELTQVLQETYPGEEVGLAGASMSSYDIASAFASDTQRVSLITIIAVFAIILLSFKNAAIPAILVFVIQGAIWICMGSTTILGEGVFFMSYLICTAIQMGATIDYGILFTGNYCRLREEYDKKQAIVEAMEASMPTIFTSGIILIVAGFIVGSVCSVFYIYSIGQILARGAAISVLLILTLLPQLVYMLDRLVTPKRIRERENKKTN